MLTALIAEKTSQLETQTAIVDDAKSAVEAKRALLKTMLGDAEPLEEFPLVKELRVLEAREAQCIQTLTELQGELESLRNMHDLERQGNQWKTTLDAIHAGGLHTGLLHIVNTAAKQDSRDRALATLHMSLNQWWGGDLPIYVAPRWQFLSNLAASGGCPEVRKAAQDALVRALNRL